MSEDQTPYADIFCSNRIRLHNKRHCHDNSVADIEAARNEPGLDRHTNMLCIDQSPLVACKDAILRQQNIFVP